MRLVAPFVAMTLFGCGSAAPPPPAPAAAVPVTAPATATARLTVTTGGGNITSTPPGIDCRSEHPPWTPTGTCSADFSRGTQVTLHFTPTMAAGFAQFAVLEPGQAPGTGAVQNGSEGVVKLDGDRSVSVSAVSIPPPPGPHH